MTIESFESDLEETQEWLDSVDGLVAAEGIDPAGHVLNRAFERARSLGVQVATPLLTDYVNTIPPSEQAPFPGDELVETRIRHYVRWNAAVMVARANRRFDGIGGHLATYASAATLYEVGFNHFFRGKTARSIGDQVFFQGHASPGIYARAFVEGRLDESQLVDTASTLISPTPVTSDPRPANRRRAMKEFP
jgi:pyruvate dehydrogenase E1 component